MLESKPIAINIPKSHKRDFCHRFRVTRLALFGSVLRSDYGPYSDVDLLVTFEPGAQVGMLMPSRMQRELSIIFGRSVDLIPESGLKPLIRDEIIDGSQVFYAP